MVDESNKPTLDNVNTLDSEALMTQEEIARPGADDAPEKKRSIPVALIIGVLAVFFLVMVAGGVAVLFALGIIGGGGTTVTLNADNPTYLHPDGIAVTAAEGGRVSIQTIPRELFVSGEAGRQWTMARDVFPSSVEPLSPLYDLNVANGEILIEIAAPNGADPTYLVDVFTWDDVNGSWDFAPSTYNPVNGTFTFTTSESGIWVVGIAQPTTPQIGIVGAQGGDFLIARGVTVDASGQVVGSPTGEAGPLFVNARAWTDYTNSASVITDLGALASLTGEGLIVRVLPGEGLVTFAADLQAISPSLTLVVEGSRLDEYNLAAFNDLPISIWLAPGLDPTIYYSGDIITLMDSFTSQVNRRRAGLYINAESADIGSTSVAPTTFQALSGLFGQVEPAAGYITDGTAPLGSPVAARLNGSVTSMGVDPVLNMAYLTYAAPDADHTVYLTSSLSLTTRISWAERYGLARIGIGGYTPDLSLAESPPPPAPLALNWVVTNASGTVVAQQSGDLSLLQYLTPPLETAGTYTINVTLQQGEASVSIGEIIFSVGE